MNSKTRINKKGSYLLESAIALPIFLIAVIVMSSIILMYACIEDCNFIAANELRRSAAESAVMNTSMTTPYRLKKEIESKHRQIESTSLEDSINMGSRWGVDDLIGVRYRLTLRQNNPLGINAKADYTLSLVTRAYVGRERNEGNMSADEFAGDGEPVFIFPKRGQKYHSKGCGFLKAASRSGSLNSSIKSKYKSCPLCHSSKASEGSLIYYFPSAGDDYHMPGCVSLQRNFIEIDKSVAIERGYTPCSKCGG